MLFYLFRQSVVYIHYNKYIIKFEYLYNICTTFFSINPYHSRHHLNWIYYWYHLIRYIVLNKLNPIQPTKLTLVWSHLHDALITRLNDLNILYFWTRQKNDLACSVFLYFSLFSYQPRSTRHSTKINFYLADSAKNNEWFVGWFGI